MIKISELTPKGAKLDITDLLEISQETSDGYESKSVTGRDIQQSVGKFGNQFGINTDTPAHSLQVESEEQCIILAKTTNATGGGVALMDGNTSDEFQVGVGAFADRLCLRSNAELFKFPTTDGTSGQAMVTDGSGNLSFASASTNPQMIGSVVGSGIMGITNQLSASVFIPAGTISTNKTIYIKAFIDRTVVSGAGASSFRFYINTSNSITGATYLGSGAAMATTVRFQRFERNIFFDGTNLNLFLTGTSSATDYTASGISLIGFNPAVDNYLLFAVQHSTSLTDVATWKKINIQLYD
jgi:hypothetical protein